jgi:hypothetical protein
MTPPRAIVKSVLTLICLVSLALTILSWVRYFGYESSIVEPLKEDLIRRTREAAGQIDGALTPARKAATEMAEQLDGIPEPTEEQLIDLLRQAVLRDESCFGGTVAFEPYEFDPERRLYAPYVARKNGELAFLRIEDRYDYTDETQEWYGKALAEGPRWSEPYFDTSVGDVLMTTYSSVFRHDGEARGVVTVDVAMDVIRNIVRSLDLGGVGYAVLLSKEGRFLYHPDEELVLSGVGLPDLTKQWNDKELIALSERILAGESGISDQIAPMTGLDTWYVHEPVPTTGWSLVAAFVKEDAPVDTGVLRQWQIRAGASLLVFLATATALGFNVLAGGRRRLWAYSIVLSVLFVAGIGSTWRIALDFDAAEDVAGSIITDNAGLLAFAQSTLDTAQERLLTPPVFVPTGLLIDSLRFDGGTDVDISGYIWQKYDPELHGGIDRGIALAGVAEQRIDEPLIQMGADGEEVVRWSFEIAQRVRFENSKYPLMRERITLRVVPRTRSSTVMLVPDLEAYPYTSPATRPGLDENVFLPGWQITRTFFELRDRLPATDFGLGAASSSESFPSLYFNIEVRKEFVDTFVSNLVPLIIVAVVVFLVLMIIEREEEQILLMRAGPGFNLSICGTLLFVAVFSHIGARQKIAAQEIIYLEYFYIVMYFALLWVAIDSILYVRCPNWKFIQYEKNLFPKVLFWPVTLGALWLTTLVTFY